MIVSALVYLIDKNLYPNAIKFVDPVLALTSIIIIIFTSVNLFKELSLILLQGRTHTHVKILLKIIYVYIFYNFIVGIPKSLPNIEDLKEGILEKCPTTVVNVHEFHIWCLEPNQILCSLHVTYNDFEVCNTQSIKTYWKF